MDEYICHGSVAAPGVSALWSGRLTMCLFPFYLWYVSIRFLYTKIEITILKVKTRAINSKITILKILINICTYNFVSKKISLYITELLDYGQKKLLLQSTQLWLHRPGPHPQTRFKLLYQTRPESFPEREPGSVRVWTTTINQLNEAGVATVGCWAVGSDLLVEDKLPIHSVCMYLLLADNISSLP